MYSNLPCNVYTGWNNQKAERACRMFFFTRILFFFSSCDIFATVLYFTNPTFLEFRSHFCFLLEHRKLFPFMLRDTEGILASDPSLLSELNHTITVQNALYGCASYFKMFAIFIFFFRFLSMEKYGLRVGKL